MKLNNKMLYTAALGVTLLASCQKDYYLDELKDAEQEIAQLQSINGAKQSEINELQNLINSLTLTLNDTEDTLEDLQVYSDSQANDISNLNTVIDSLSLQLNNTIYQLETTVVSNTLEVNALNEEITSLSTLILSLQEVIQDHIDNPVIVEVEVIREVVIDNSTHSVSIREVEVIVEVEVNDPDAYSDGYNVGYANGFESGVTSSTQATMNTNTALSLTYAVTTSRVITFNWNPNIGATYSVILEGTRTGENYLERIGTGNPTMAEVSWPVHTRYESVTFTVQIRDTNNDIIEQETIKVIL